MDIHIHPCWHFIILFYCEHSKVGLSYLCGKGGNSVKRSIVIFPRKEYHSEHRTAMGVGRGTASFYVTQVE
jgi:hypothetical protein